MSATPRQKNCAGGRASMACLAVAIIVSGCDKTPAPTRAKPATAPKATPVMVITTTNTADFVSVFEDLPPQTGKDPFFPTSRRREPSAPPPTTAPVHVTPTLILKGIVGSTSRRMAIINNETMEQGEESSIRAGASHVRVKCLEIGDNSVLVQIEGESQPKKLVMEHKK